LNNVKNIVIGKQGSIETAVLNKHFQDQDGVRRNIGNLEERAASYLW